MSENVGTIFYEIDADTAPLDKGAARANKSLDKLQGGLNDTDKAALKTERALNKTGSEMDGVSRKAGALGSALTPLAAAIAGVMTAQTLATWGKMAEEFTLLQSRIARLSADADSAKASYQALLSIASATGANMADTVKLWESLTGTLKALGATNSQVLTLTSTLQKIGAIGGSSAEETAGALRQLGQGLASGTLRAEEFNSVVEGMPELARQIATGFGMSMGELRKAMLDGKITAEALFEVLVGRTAEVDREFAKLPRTVSQAANAVSTQFGAALSVIDQMIGASQKLARVLDGIAKGIQITFNPNDQQRLAQLLQDRVTAEQQYQTQMKFGLSVSAKATQSRIDGINSEIKAIQDRRVAELKAASGEGGGGGAKATPSTNDDAQKAVQALAEQNQQLRAQGVERAKIIALQKVGAGATQSEKDAAVALAIENYSLQEAEKQAQKDRQAGIAATRKAESEAAQQKRKDEAEARRADERAKKGAEQNIQVFAKLGVELAGVGKSARELAQDQAALSLNKYATPEQVESVRALAGALYDAKYAQQQLAAANPVAAAEIGYQNELTQLQELNAQKLLSDQEYLELKNAAETQYDARRLAAQEEIFAAQSRGNAFLIDSLNALQGTSTQVFAGLLTGAMSGADAVRALANTILNQAVGAVVEWGFAQLKAIIMGQTAQQAATAAAVVQGAALEAAYAPAAISASIASFGAAPAAATAAMTANVPLMTAALHGARRHGGPVSPGGMYRVNEGGKPEVFNAGGQQYMIPTQRGEVVSNKDATAAASSQQAAPSINVNLIESADRGGQVESDGQGGMNIFVSQIRNGGDAAKVMESTYGLKRVGR